MYGTNESNSNNIRSLPIILLKNFSFLKKVGILMKKIEKLLEIFATIILILLVTTVLIQVISRLIGVPMVWTEELGRGLLVYVSLLGGGLAYYKGQGFKITFVLDRFSPKYIKLTELLVLLVSMVLIVFTFYTSYVYIYQTGGTPTPLLNIPKIVILISFPLGLILIMIRLIRDFKNIIK